MEREFLKNLFRSEIYHIIFKVFNKYDKKDFNELISTYMFKYNILYEEFANKPKFQDQIDCIKYFDAISLWNIVEYVRLKNVITEHMGDISYQSMIQKCNLSWLWIAEDIIEEECNDIIKCYQDKC